MRTYRHFVFAASSLTLVLSALQHVSAKSKKGEGFRVPVIYYKLPNGLRVVLSQDTTAPTVTVATYYRIGFRIEPKDRTGYAKILARRPDDDRRCRRQEQDR